MLCLLCLLGTGVSVNEISFDDELRLVHEERYDDIRQEVSHTDELSVYGNLPQV